MVGEGGDFLAMVVEVLGLAGYTAKIARHVGKNSHLENILNPDVTMSRSPRNRNPQHVRSLAHESQLSAAIRQGHRAYPLRGALFPRPGCYALQARTKIS